MKKPFLLCLVLFLVLNCNVSGEDDTKSPTQKRGIFNTVVRTNAIPKNYKTTTYKPGFFKTLFQVVGEQWADTKKTMADVNKVINDGFLPENAPPTTVAPVNTNPNVSTTAAPYKIKRSEMVAILRKNLLGIARLVNIEVNDALKQSEKEWPVYKQNITKEIWKFL